MRNRRPNGGELHGTAKLTVPDVIAIRKLAGYGLSHRVLGSMFGVSHTNIGDIVRGKEWRQLLRRSGGQEVHAAERLASDARGRPHCRQLIEGS